MFFYGVKSKSIKIGKLTNIHCNYCDKESKMEYEIEQKYFHLYFIPFIPLKKRTTVCCENCWTVFEKKHFSNDINIKLNRANDRNPVRTPIWTFSGSILLALLIVWAFWQSGRHEVTEGDYIKNPKKGDVYFTETHPAEYTTIYSTLRIDKVDKANVYFTYNDTSVTKYTKVFGILNERYYTSKKGIYARKKIEELYKKDSIISITRK